MKKNFFLTQILKSTPPFKIKSGSQMEVRWQSEGGRWSNIGQNLIFKGWVGWSGWTKKNFFFIFDSGCKPWNADAVLTSPVCRLFFVKIKKKQKIRTCKQALNYLISSIYSIIA